MLQLDNDAKEKGNRKIWLSLRLSLLHKGFCLDSVQEGMVLTAYIKSIEDHGYILHFGLTSFMGFLPKTSQAAHGAMDLNTGQLIQGVVRNIDKIRKVVYLSSDPDTVSKCVIKDVKGISIDLLIPGMMVNAHVKSTLENGVMLSFLTYFTGTADRFHLENSFPTTKWMDDYYQNKKVNARILFIDPSTRAVGLTLNSHLVHNKTPPMHVKIGDIYEAAKVVRVDRGLGLLLEIPSAPVSTPAYVSISDVADEKGQKLEKKFKEASRVRVRILGFRHLDGLATGILKASAFDGPVFTHSDVKAGMVVRAKVLTVKSFGAIVQFPGGVKALCPLCHMSEFEIAKPGKRFEIGAELTFRVLGCKSKRITVTHKKTLVKSKLGIVSSYAEAVDGLITHGWITKIGKHRCHVHFYNGVKGSALISELGLDPNCNPSSMYHVGQVVKCRIMKSDPASRHIRVSFIIKPPSASKEDIVNIGSIVSGVVDRVTPNAVVVNVNAKGYSKGTIFTEHLSDHHGLAEVMMSVLKPGYEFDKLLILEAEGYNLVLSVKHSLINLTEILPSEPNQVRPNSIVHGYICNIIESGCFIRFLGRLTGFCPKSKAMDQYKAVLSEAFCIGQSVRSNVLDVSGETGRITVSLKQSCCSSTDAYFIQEYFLLEEKIAKLQSQESSTFESMWDEKFNIGNIVEGKIQKVNDTAVVVGFENYDSVLGVITHHQLSGRVVETGSSIQAVVLDVAKSDALVDLSLKMEFIENVKGKIDSNHALKKKRRREAYKGLEVHQTVKAIVEIVKENYLVLSIPDYNYALGYASIFDYNTQNFPKQHYLNGQSIVATVMALPSPYTTGRLLLLLKSSETEISSSKRAKKKSGFDVGSVVQAEITDIRPLGLMLKFGVSFHGRVHITEVSDDIRVENPFSKFRIGEIVMARIIAKTSHLDKKKKSHQWDLSLKPSLCSGSTEIGEKLMTEDLHFSTGQCVTGYVYRVDGEWVWLALSRSVRAQIYILDSACEPSELQEFKNRFHVGKAVNGHVLSIDSERRLLRLVPRSFVTGCNEVLDGDVSNRNVAHIHEGCILGGRISKLLPGVGGLVVQIDPHLYGRVHYTELKDSWVSEPLSGYKEGQFVKCKVLEVGQSVNGTFHIDLSLRSSLDGMFSNESEELHKGWLAPVKRLETVEDICPNMIVHGYVKHVTSKGCFILLSRKLDAKVLISNLSDGYVDDLEKDFPLGKLVIGRVLSVEPLSKRVEVTLKTLSAGQESNFEINNFSALKVGDIVSGTIKRVESFGLFITIDNTNLVGLCHKSELSDDQVDQIESNYRARERVVAKILKVDAERHRFSLGMKDTYIIEGDNVQEPSRVEAVIENGLTNNTKIISLCESGFLGEHNLDVDCQNMEFPVLAQIESRSSVPPLEVTLDDMDHSDLGNRTDQTHHIDRVDALDEKSKRLAKKKANEEKEREIRAAEERQLEKDMPRTAEEFEKLIRSSPNSSFVWVKYMAFILSMADVDKARAIAERALKAINFREENEKLNIWVAYLNLENEYGNPPDEAVMKVFQRALQFNDPKKVHIALLGMYEKTEQHKLADELMGKMTKRFKHSCKVWLRRVQMMLKRKEDEVDSVVNRALLVLPKHKHIKFISQTAILEFKCGVPDRGRSMFEGVLKEYPKRTDLWSIYLDQEIRFGDMDVIRALFERAISLSLPPKKMKFLFKKYLEFEKSIGDEERIESVKQKAMDYVSSTLA